MPHITTESSYNIYDDDEGVYVSVGSDRDGLDCVRIFTEGEKSIEWFGAVDVTLSPDIAEAVANAILRKVKDMRETKSDRSN